MNDTPNVYQSLAAAAQEIGAVGKDQKMSAGPAKYNYRGLDDLVDAVHPILARNGVTFAPLGVNVIQEMEKQTRSGSIQYHIRAIVTYAIYGPAGDHITASVLAEGTDTGDKAGNKLMSAAYKYALGQVLSIPYTMDDQDATLSEPVAVQHDTPEKAIAAIHASADQIGKTFEEVTAKYREQHGGIGPDEMPMTSLSDLTAFANQLSTYINNGKK